ncbi:unnamed protein product [Camellia sinensis]
MEKNRKSSRGLSASPMEISLQSATDNCGADTSEQNGIISEPPPPPLAEDKVLVSSHIRFDPSISVSLIEQFHGVFKLQVSTFFLVSVEVCLKPSSTAQIEDVRSTVEIMLEKRSLSYIDGPVPVPLDDSFLVENVQRICVCDMDEWVENHDILLFWQVKPDLVRKGRVKNLVEMETSKKTGQKSLALDTAIGMWQLLFEEKQWPLVDHWCQFLQARHNKAISRDTWSQLLEFARTCMKWVTVFSSFSSKAAKENTAFASPKPAAAGGGDSNCNV